MWIRACVKPLAKSSEEREREGETPLGFVEALLEHVFTIMFSCAARTPIFGSYPLTPVPLLITIDVTTSACDSSRD